VTHRPAAVSVSVVVATRNRCERLAEAMGALARSVVPPGLTWELVVVDNGSTDGTADLLARAASELPLRSVHEPVPGLSVARNTGLGATRGRIIAFTDDDCLVDSQWLATLWREFERDAALAGVGGRVELYDPRDRPVSIRISRSRMPFTSPVQLSELFIGCNMAFRRHVIDLVGEFDPTLGAGTPVGSGEDLDFLYRAFRRGFKLVYVPEMLVHHNHGRRTDAEVGRLRRSYGRGRGALFCKYLLRGDRGMLRRLAADLASGGREALGMMRAGRAPWPVARRYWHMLTGALAWLRSRRRANAVRRAPQVVTAAHPPAPIESSETPLRSRS
jgi:glycosyltransferase involved in cell wall biosynthesis